MADPSQAADGGLLSSLPGQIGAGLAGAGVLWRLLIAFGRQDRAAKMEQELRDELRQQNAKMTEDLNRMAHERNDAVQVRLQLETKLSMTEERLGSTRTERDEARAALARVQADVERLTSDVHRLTEEAVISEARGASHSQPIHSEAKPATRHVPGEQPWR